MLSTQDFIHQLLSGNIVTIPTETVEGFAVALSSISGIKKLMELKQRDINSGKVFTLVPSSVTGIQQYVQISPLAQRLINTYIPGELTILLPKNPDFQHPYFDHFDIVGIRIPDYPLFQQILPHTGPLLLTSANPRGGTPKSITGHLPSTIIDLSQSTPKIIRQGNLYIDFQ